MRILRLTVILSMVFSGLLQGSVRAADDDIGFAIGLFGKKEYQLAGVELAKIKNSNPNHPRMGEVLFFLGMSYFRLNDFSSAIPVLERFTREYKTSTYHAEGLYKLGRAYFNRENYKAALNSFVSFGKHYSDSYLADAAAYWQAEALYQQGDINGALRAYSRFLKSYPKSDFKPNAYYGRGWAYIDNKQAQVAAADFVSLASEFADNDLAQEALFLAGEQYFIAGRASDSILQYRKCARAGGDLAAKAIYAAGWVLHAQKEYLQAADEFALVAKNFANHSLAFESTFLRAYMLYLARSYEKSIDILTALARNPGDISRAKIDYYRGLALSKMGQKKAALVAYNQALRVSDIEVDLFARLHHDAAVLLLDMKSYADVYKHVAQLTVKAPQHELADDGAYVAVLAADGSRDWVRGLSLCDDFFKSFSASSVAAAVQFAKAKFLFELQKFSEAAKAYNVFVARYPKDQRLNEAKLRSGIAYYRAGDLAQAAPILRALQNGPVGDEALFVLIKMDFEKGKYREVIATNAQLARKRNSKFIAKGLMYKGLAEIELKQFGAAQKSLQACLNLKPEASIEQQAKLFLAEAHMGEGRYDKALKSFLAYQQHYPQGTFSSQAKRGEAMAQYQLKNYQVALGVFGELEKMSDDKKTLQEAAYFSGRSCEQQGRYSDAIDHYRRATRLQGEFSQEAGYRIVGAYYKAKNYRLCSEEAQRYMVNANATYKPLALYDYAWAKEALGDAVESRSIFAQFLNSYPTHEFAPEVAMKLGEIEFYKHRYVQALQFYQRVLSLADGGLHDKALYKIASAQRALNNSDLAVKNFEALLQKFPQSTLVLETYYHLGSLYQKTGQLIDALQTFKKARGVTAQQGDKFKRKCLIGEADVYRLRDSHRNAIKLYKVLTKNPSDQRERGVIYFGYGESLRASGAYRDAISVYQKAIEGNTGELAAGSQYGIGLCFKSLKEYDDAIKAFLKVNINYGFKQWQEDALYQLVFCNSLMGAADKVKKYGNEYLRKYPEGKRLREVRKFLGV